MTKKIFMIIVLMVLFVSTGCMSKHQYDIETAFDSEGFIQIIEGDITPVEIRHGLGGECGYSQDISQDPKIISAYIEAFRSFKLKEIIKDEDDFKYVADGINDYIFFFDDGSSVMISLDLNAYVIKDGKQYIYEYSQELHDLNKMIAEAETEP